MSVVADKESPHCASIVEKGATLEHCEISPETKSVAENDALKVISAYTGDREWTPDEEKKLVRKIDLQMMSLLAVSYGLQYYDKALLGQAVSVLSHLADRKHTADTCIGDFRAS